MQLVVPLWLCCVQHTWAEGDRLGSCCPEEGSWLGCQWGEARLGSHLGSTDYASGMPVGLDQETDQLAMKAVESSKTYTTMVRVALWLSQTTHPAFSALCVFGCRES